jgi:hypothetical protein
VDLPVEGRAAADRTGVAPDPGPSAGDPEGHTHTASPIEGTDFVPDGRPAHLPDVSQAELRSAAARVVPQDFLAEGVIDVRPQGPLIRVETADGRVTYFRPEVGHGLRNVAQTTVRTGSPDDPHLTLVNDRVAPDQLTRTWVHEITETLYEQNAVQRRSQPQGVVRRLVGSILRLFGQDAPAPRPDGGHPEAGHGEGHVRARLNERNLLLRRFDSATSVFDQLAIRNELMGIDRDLAALGHRTDTLPFPSVTSTFAAHSPIPQPPPPPLPPMPSHTPPPPPPMPPPPQTPTPQTPPSPQTPTPPTPPPTPPTPPPTPTPPMPQTPTVPDPRSVPDPRLAWAGLPEQLAAAGPVPDPRLAWAGLPEQLTPDQPAPGPAAAADSAASMRLRIWEALHPGVPFAPTQSAAPTPAAEPTPAAPEPAPATAEHPPASAEPTAGDGPRPEPAATLIDVPPPVVDGPTYPSKDLPRTWEGEDAPPDKNTVWPGQQVRYLDAHEREAYRIFVRDGLLYRTDGTLFDTSNAGSLWSSGGRAIFVMDPHGNLYAANQHARGEFHHSSFLAGGPISGAGELRVIDGRLELVSDQSGHYRPPRQLTRQVVDLLRQSGVSIADNQVEFHALEEGNP